MKSPELVQLQADLSKHIQDVGRMINSKRYQNDLDALKNLGWCLKTSAKTLKQIRKLIESQVE